MFSTIESAISIDDELAALLADHAAYTGDGSDLVVADPGADLPDPGPETPLDADPLTVVDPMVTADAVAFTGDTTPDVVDTDAPTDPAPAITSDPDLADVAVDPSVLPALDGLFQLDGDGGFDLDLTILGVGRALGQFGFTDLP